MEDPLFYELNRKMAQLIIRLDSPDQDVTTTAVMDTAAVSPNPGPKRQRVGSFGNGLAARQYTGRCCFVTVGATAGFRSLLDEVSTAQFLDCLATHGYTSLNIQCGPDHAAVEQRIAILSDEEKRGISVRCFRYTDEMTANILNCRGEDNVRPAGCVISHGGTGTVGEVLAIGAPLIVVANPTLMDNHQLELAETLAAHRLAVHGHIGSLDIAIQRIADRITQGTLDALPPYNPPSFPVPAADRVALFDWMVLTCYPEDFATQMRIADLGLAEAEFLATQQPIYQQPEQPVAAINSDEDARMLQLD